MATTKTCELSGLYLYSETAENGKKYYYLRAHYDVEDEFRKTEIIYPKISLPISNDGSLPIARDENLCLRHLFINPDMSIDIGFGNTPCMRDGINDAYMYEIVKEEKPQKMTLSEIEKKLGHKIILVNEGKYK